MKLFILFFYFFSSLLFAKYDNCLFKNPNYVDICKKVVANGVSYEYANRFLLSYFKTQKYDEITWKYIQPSKIKYHKEQEKKANKILIKSISKMVKNMKEYQPVYDLAEVKYGVNREIIAAILLKETNFGEVKPTHDAFVVFNTILVRTKPKTVRQKRLLKMSKTNMASIIEYCYKKKRAPDECNLLSSYAGAVGIPQFMPNSFVYAKSYYTKVPDLMKMEDAILSVAKFLHKKAKFTKLINFRRIANIAKIEKEWYLFASKNKNSSFFCKKSKKKDKKVRCFMAKRAKIDYLGEYMKKIMKYNSSVNYAIGVIRLAYEAHRHF